MTNIIDLIINLYMYIAVIGLLSLTAFALFLLIQFISYRIFNFNLYKYIGYHLIDKQIVNK